MAALVAENFKFVSLFFKSKDVMMFNGLIALGTVAGQTAYNVFAFHCPCSPARNYLYGLAAMGVPALVLFLVGVMLNHNTWDILSECRLKRCWKLSGVALFALLASIVGRAAVAPITWSVLSLLRGEAYVCALSEFVDPASITDFPSNISDVPGVMAGFPCKDVPEELLQFWSVIERRLKYESQLLGWILVGSVALSVFLMLCLRHCCSPLGYQQEEYWSHFRSQENRVFSRTMDAHAHIQAIRNVRSFFGFAALDKDEQELLENTADAKTQIPSLEWNRITGVYLYRENQGMPLYSRLHKWSTYKLQNNVEAMEKDMNC
ncbi:calcium homeostasis modulator protein 2.1 [Clupea harengus]|uniref:Calcium homeostasis modulator protein 2.1 n=1 Tax=Clupea harengus TaxID=7950 RepID=A0A6P3WDD8_CLUHA|nr:calcium homeostasis modulator protein 2.1 [Clupea harengus]